MKRRALAGWVMVVAALVAAGVAAFVANRRPSLELGLDGATPRVQNGIAAVDVETIADGGVCVCRDAAAEPFWARMVRLVRGGPAPAAAIGSSDDAGGIGVWVRPVHLAAGRAGVGFPRASAVARFPNGDTFPLSCVPTGAYWLLTMPGGYPNTFRSVDVLFSDGSGHTARWRVVGLPPSKHAVPPPVALQPSFQSNGITVTGRAWVDPSLPARARDCIRYDLLVRGNSAPSSHWQVVQSGITTEWNANAPTLDSVYTVSEFNGRELQNATVVSAVYPRYQRFARLSGELRQYDTCAEKVTFHTIGVRDTGSFLAAVVDREQAVRTPSGIVVTLPRQGDRPRPPTSTAPNGAIMTMRLDFPTEAAPDALPNSPLCRRHRALRQPLSITLGRLSAPWSLMGCDTSGVHHDTNDVELRLPPRAAVPNPVRALTLLIRQRVTVRTIPFTLTIPVEAAKPSGALRL